ncbi:MAG: sugar ABC transporter ATP-binding protein [Trueperaceae bacterium]|nr:MAG: sugar ABC transporter ATP-binding protein [Trueperaceae bacterium]
MSDYIIELKNITKSFGNVNAVEGVSLQIKPGEVVGLIGDNGAGKSTLIKILSGVHPPDKGEIFVRGEKVSHWNAARSRLSGIETVYQDRALVIQQSITRNIFMGREIQRRFGFVDTKKQRQEANRLMRDIGFTSKVFDPDSPVATLSGGERQGVAIARALYFDAELIILDEPTTALSLTETRKVFSFIENVRARGKSIIFIGHNIYHVYDVAERFIVLDRGKIVLTSDKTEVSSAEYLIETMHDIAETGHAEIHA